MFTEPDPSYHGLAYWPALGAGSFILKARVQLLRDIGAAVSPMNAFLFLQGIETLSLRMERHVANAVAVADYLESHPQVDWVLYAGLESSPYNERARKYLPKGAGSVLAFGIDGGIKAGQKFVESLRLHSHVANIGDVRSLAIHPASTTHSQLTPQEQSDTGVEPNLVRHRDHRRHHRRPRHRLRGRSQHLTLDINGRRAGGSRLPARRLMQFMQEVAG